MRRRLIIDPRHLGKASRLTGHFRVVLWQRPEILVAR